MQVCNAFQLLSPHHLWASHPCQPFPSSLPLPSCPLFYPAFSLSPLNLTRNVGVSGFRPIHWNLVGSAVVILLVLCLRCGEEPWGETICWARSLTPQIFIEHLSTPSTVPSASDRMGYVAGGELLVYGWCLESVWCLFRQRFQRRDKGPLKEA